jgi:hypothetical protein
MSEKGDGDNTQTEESRSDSGSVQLLEWVQCYQPIYVVCYFFFVYGLFSLSV